MLSSYVKETLLFCIAEYMSASPYFCLFNCQFVYLSVFLFDNFSALFCPCFSVNRIHIRHRSYKATNQFLRQLLYFFMTLNDSTISTHHHRLALHPAPVKSVRGSKVQAWKKNVRKQGLYIRWQLRTRFASVNKNMYFKKYAFNRSKYLFYSTRAHRILSDHPMKDPWKEGRCEPVGCGIRTRSLDIECILGIPLSTVQPNNHFSSFPSLRVLGED